MIFRFFKIFMISLLGFCMLTESSHATIAEEILAGIQKPINYILCFDGGGSKTELVIVGKDGKKVPLLQNENILDAIIGEGSNINTSGEDGVTKILENLLQKICVGNPETSLQCVAQNCLVVGGFSGAGSQKNVDILKKIFKNFGFLEDRIIITSDAAMCLESVGEPAIIIIAGTGSICFGKRGSQQFRVGGLGPRIDKGGSGYHVGRDAIKAVLEHDYGWGQPTSLTPIIKEHFDITDVRSIVGPINGAQIPVQKIAQLSKKVFDEAAHGDFVSQSIIAEAAHYLGNLLTLMVSQGEFSPCCINFFGGLFKSPLANEFVDKILETAQLDKSQWDGIFIRAHENPTVTLVQQILTIEAYNNHKKRI